MSDWNEAIEAAAKGIAWSQLTDKGRAECNWHVDFSESERDKYRVMAGAALAAANFNKRPAPLDGGWMPINTLECNRDHHGEYFISERVLMVNAAGKYKITTLMQTLDGRRGLFADDFAPTHWQPLPAAPASTEKAEGE